MKARNVHAKFGSPYGRARIDRSRSIRPTPENPAPIPKLQPYRGCNCALCTGENLFFRNADMLRYLAGFGPFFRSPSPDVKDQKAPGPPEKIPLQPFKAKEFVSARPWMYFIGGPKDGDRLCIPYPINGQSWLWAAKLPIGEPSDSPFPLEVHKYIFHEIFLPDSPGSRWIALHESLSLGNPGLMPSILVYISPLPPSADDE